MRFNAVTAAPSHITTCACRDATTGDTDTSSGPNWGLVGTWAGPVVTPGVLGPLVGLVIPFPGPAMGEVGVLVTPAAAASAATPFAAVAAAAVGVPSSPSSAAAAAAAPFCVLSVVAAAAAGGAAADGGGTGLPRGNLSAASAAGCC